MSNKLVITEIEINNKKRIFSGLYSKEKNCFLQANFSKPKECEQIGDVYIGRVKDISKNINAAFVNYQSDKIGYLSLADNEKFTFLSPKNTSRLCQGDLILVQLEKAAIKTKYPVLSSTMSITGKYLVINTNKTGLGFSNKIQSKEVREKLKKYIQRAIEMKNVPDFLDNNGIVIRTGAKEAGYEEIYKEFSDILSKINWINLIANKRSCYSVLYKENTEYLKLLKGSFEIEEVISDLPSILDEINENISCEKINIVKYDDNLLPLSKLYNLEGLVDKILSKKVWLKSGAYLVIEITEAMTVIDVNTGKCIKGKEAEETIYNVNIEAAEEIASQIRLRNLSGIIIIDFINMKNEDTKIKVMEKLKKLVMYDPVKTVVVDMTELDLVELTRKKISPPIFEQL